MRRGPVILIAALVFGWGGASLQGLSCSQESEKELVQAADHVLVVRITETRWIEVEEEGESYGLVKAKYDLVESLKGSEQPTGEVFDMPLGYGTGFIGFIPGVYYLLVLDDEQVYQDVPIIDPCVRALATLNLDGLEARELLAEIRGFLDAEKK